MRQVCNLAYATITAGMDAEQRQEFLEDLTEDDTSWEAQADQVYARLRAQGYQG